MVQYEDDHGKVPPYTSSKYEFFRRRGSTELVLLINVHGVLKEVKWFRKRGR
jgi:hypothetical protein